MTNAPAVKVELTDLRQKWQEIPIGAARAFSQDLLQMGDAELSLTLKEHSKNRDEHSPIGWYFPVYRDAFKGKRILEIGSGAGLDGVTFMRSGAHWTFSDISQQNLSLAKRHVEIEGLDPSNADFFYIDSFSSFLRLPANFDFIWADGSLLHLPFDDVRMECLAIVSRLKPGGRWIELTYPKRRWLREGSQPFSRWGEITDGPGTPWAEWYDTAKLHRRLAPAKLRTLFSYDYYNSALNWHDLQLLEKFEYSSAIENTALVQASLIETSGCNGCEIKTLPNGFRVTTGSDIWSYAAFVPTGSIASAEIECIVESGSVGLAIVDSELNFVSDEVIIDAHDDVSRSIAATTTGSAAGIIFRNASGCGRSTISVHSIAITNGHDSENRQVRIA